MISQQGRVVATDGDEVIVNIGGVSGCPACDAGKGCGAGIFGRLLRDRTVNIALKNSIDAVDGQGVKVGISEQGYLQMVFRLYVWPLTAGLIGVILGFMFAGYSGQTGWMADLLGLFAGILVAGFALLQSRRKLREFPSAMKVHLLGILDAPAGSQCALTQGKQTNLEVVNNDPDDER